MDLEQVKNYYLKERERILSELKQFLSFKSISTNSSFKTECIQCAKWLSSHFEACGLESTLIETPTLPLVYSWYNCSPEAPTVVFYGHYDVQPPDPLEAWESDPFCAVEKNGRLYARGAQDNKGQLFYFVKAVEFLLKQKALNCNLKIIIEGEEESGGKGITSVLNDIKDKIKGDVLLVCDTGTPYAEAGAVTVGLRGIIALTVEITGPRKDLHSGVHGGVAPNPAQILCTLLSSLHNKDGSVAVKGFYEGIAEPTAEELKLLNTFPVTDNLYKELTGVLPLGGERDKDLLIRRGFRPTLEINGITSGYTGQGMKTIVPHNAEAKISCRTVVGQKKPEELLNLVCSQIEKNFNDMFPNKESGLHLRIKEKVTAGEALKVNPTSWHIQKASEILKEITGKETIFIWEGASIPIISELSKVSGALPLLVGFGLEEDNIHAPNESFSLEQFMKGFLFCSLFLSKAEK